jgi:L-ascorbate metabolism protein UlaG (beta-lactamase superfamily)
LTVSVCNYKILFDPVLTQNAKKAGRAGRKQWKTHRTNGGKKHKSEPK